MVNVARGEWGNVAGRAGRERARAALARRDRAAAMKPPMGVLLT